MTAAKPLSKREQNRQNKRNRALEAALTVFSQYGFAAATMDAIAAEAGLTKPTLYQYFPSKEALFREMLLAPRTKMLTAFHHTPDACHVTQLWDFAWRYTKTVMQPEFLALARLIIGDAQRTTELGRAYQASGPDKVLSGLADFMTLQADLGQLNVENAELAAEDFWGLILSAPRNRALHEPDVTFDKAALSKYVHNGIKVFLKAYSTAPADDLEKLAELIENNSSTTEAP